MDTTTRHDNSLVGLIEGLRENFRDLLHEEVQLAKTELSEKVSYFGRNSVYLGIGAAAGYLALVLLLVSLGFLISYAFEGLGLSTGMALFLGFLAMAVVLGAVSGALVGKALSAFSKQSIVPEKTIETLKEIKAGGLQQAPVRTTTIKAPEPEDNRTSDQIRADIEKTRREIHREATGVRRRLDWGRVATGMVSTVKRNPGKSVGIGLGTTLAGVVLMRVARLFGRRRMA